MRTPTAEEIAAELADGSALVVENLPDPHDPDDAHTLADALDYVHLVVVDDRGRALVYAHRPRFDGWHLVATAQLDHE